MKNPLVLTLLIIASFTIIEGKKLSWGRGSSSRRGTSGSSYKPAPTSLSHAQSSYNVGQKPSSSLSGWQEKSAGTKSSKPTQTHSYPSSGTGLSGSGNHRHSQQDHQQKSHSYPQSSAGSGHNTNTNQQNHGYPTSHGLSGSGNTGTGAGYPPSSGLSGNTGSGAGYPKQQGGLSGAPQSNYPSHSNNNGAVPPPYSASGYPGAAPHPYPGHNAGHSGSQYPANNYQGAGYHHPPGAPPAYSNNYGGGGGFGGYSGGGGYGSHYSGGASQMPGYFGNYNNNRGVSRSGSVLKGVGIAGAGIGTVLTGLALWNLARSTGRQHHTVIYDNRGQPVAVAPDNSTNPAETDSILADLVNCTLTIDNGNSTEVLAIPCAIATSFTPDAKVDDVTLSNSTDNTKCTITVLTKAGREFMTTIPCSILLNSASQNNVTEPPAVPNDGKIENVAVLSPELQGVPGQEIANCTMDSDGKLDPTRPCYNSVANLTVTQINESADTAPAAA